MGLDDWLAFPVDSYVAEFGILLYLSVGRLACSPCRQLWWQYRSHRCCFMRDPSSKQELKKTKSNRSVRVRKKVEKSGQENIVNILDDSPSNTVVNAENKNKKARKQKPRTKLKYLSQYNKHSGENVPSKDTMDDKNLEERSKMSEASQTTNDTKSAVVMEFSTVQKVVQILDNDSDIKPGTLSVRNFTFTKDTEDKEKKQNYDVTHTFDASSIVPDQKKS